MLPRREGIISLRGVSIPLNVLAAALAVSPGVAAAGNFEAKVLPVLRANCLPCHSADQHTSGFSIKDIASVVAGGARHGAAVKPGDPDASPLVQMLRGTLKPRMPFGKAMAAPDLAVIETWIR